jgi:DNA-binding SARP family transcriptional activator/tetratricopeptide (TPR) repeat protein
VQLTVLGPLEVVSDGGRLALGGPKQRLVLGLLAASRRRVVTLDELIDGLWPEGPQAQPRKTVQVYVTRLRNALGANADAIRSEAAGYRLDTDVLPVDADAFEADVRSVTRDLDDAQAIALLRRALERWRGDAFVDLRDCPLIVPSAVGLDELRLRAQHELFEHEVRLRPRAVISELENAVETNPLDEGFAALLMTAQYRAGRQADALASYHNLRRRLTEELGLEPGPAIRDLELRILRHELPVTIRTATTTATAASERQRRRVTVLATEITIGRIGGSGDIAALDPEEELAIVAPLRQAARAQVLHRGGVVLAEAGDSLTACFGYPAGDRSVDNAVRAGLAIRDHVASSNAAGNGTVAVRIGIDTGVVVVETGTEGGGPADLVGIAGEPLRTATVLRDRAGVGEVLLGAGTATAVGSAIELEDAPAGALAVRAGEPEPRPHGDPPGLIGRDRAARELATLAADAEHRWCPVVVTGPPGIGKTALVDEFLAVLDRPATIVRVQCDRRSAVIPLHPFRPLFAELFEGDTEPTARAIAAALCARWDGPPVLVVEDVDAADPSTLDVLTELPARLPRGLVLLTSRSSQPFELGGDLVAAITLGPLDRAAARRLAAAVAGEQRLPLDTLNTIAERAGGVPLYVEALARAATDATGEPKTSRVPASVYDSLMAQLDRLGAARGTVQRCSVLGDSFAFTDLALVGGEGAGIDREGLAVAVDKGVLVEREGGYRFAQDLTAAGAYESMLLSERATLHARVADALSLPTARAEPERLAFHLEAAGRVFEAAVAWRRASGKAIRANRHRDAQHHARSALRLLDRLGADDQPDGGDNRRRALVNLAIGLQATSHGSAELLDVIGRLRADALEEVDPGRAIVVALIDVSNRQALGDFAAAERVARDTVATAQQLGDAASVAFAQQFLGATLLWSGQLAEGVAELEASAGFWDHDAAPAAVAARTFGALWSSLGLAAWFQGNADDAAELIARAKATIPAEDGYGRCLVGAIAATVDQLGGRGVEVRAGAEPVWSLAMDLSSDFWMRWAQTLLGWAIAAEPGEADWRNGVSMMAEVVDDTSATRQAAPYFAYLLGSRLGERGRFGEGLDRLEAGLAVAAQTGENLWVPLLHLARAACLGGSGNLIDALAAADDASAAAEAMGSTMIVDRCREWRAGSLQ